MSYLTNKQLLKRLVSQQNRFIGIVGYSFHLCYYNQTEGIEFYSVSILDKYHVIYKEYFNISYDNLLELLQNLKQFVNDLLNK